MVAALHCDAQILLRNKHKTALTLLSALSAFNGTSPVVGVEDRHRVLELGQLAREGGHLCVPRGIPK